MATIMTPEEFTRKHGGDLDALENAIEEARNDAITKESMNQESLTSHNMTPETEQLYIDYLVNHDKTSRFWNVVSSYWEDVS